MKILYPKWQKLLGVVSVLVSIGCPVYAAPPLSPTVKWQVPLGAPVDASPAIGPDGTVYEVSDNDLLYALNPTNGHTNWTHQLNPPQPTPPSVSVGTDGTIYVLNPDYLTGECGLNALSPSGGGLQWQFGVGGSGMTIPAIDGDGTIYVTAPNGLWAINANGTEQWFLGVTGLDTVASSPSVGPDGTIYFTSSVDQTAGHLWAVSPAGNVKWRCPIRFLFSVEDYYNPIDNSPAIVTNGVNNSNYTIYVGAADENVYAINPNGTTNWVFNSGGDVFANSAAIDTNGNVYITGGQCDLWKISPRGVPFGNPGSAWFNPHPFSPPDNGSGYYLFCTPAIGGDGTVYVSCTDANVYALNSSGSNLWTFATGGPVTSSPVVGTDGTVYFGSEDGNFYAVEGSAALATNSPWPMLRGNASHGASLDSYFRVLLTSPFNGEIFVGDSHGFISGTLSASVNTGPGASIRSVSFYGSGPGVPTTLLDTISAPPYTVTLWSQIPPGQFNVWAQATDTYGRTAASQLVTVQVEQ